MSVLEAAIQEVIREFGPGELFTSSDIAEKLNRKNGASITTVLSDLTHKGVLRRRQNYTYERKTFTVEDICNILSNAVVRPIIWDNKDNDTISMVLQNDMVLGLSLNETCLRQLHSVLERRILTEFMTTTDL